MRRPGHSLLLNTATTTRPTRARTSSFVENRSTRRRASQAGAVSSASPVSPRPSPARAPAAGPASRPGQGWVLRPAPPSAWWPSRRGERAWTGPSLGEAGAGLAAWPPRSGWPGATAEDPTPTAGRTGRGRIRPAAAAAKSGRRTGRQGRRAGGETGAGAGADRPGCGKDRGARRRGRGMVRGGMAKAIEASGLG